MGLLRELIEDNGLCPTCEGHGKYQLRSVSQGEYVVQWVYCEDCEGSGYAAGDGDVD